MKTTNDCIKYLSEHAWLNKQFKKLKPSDLETLKEFLDLSFDDKEKASLALTKFFISRPASKNKLIVDELLSCAISFRFN